MRAKIILRVQFIICVAGFFVALFSLNSGGMDIATAMNLRLSLDKMEQLPDYKPAPEIWGKTSKQIIGHFERCAFGRRDVAVTCLFVSGAGAFIALVLLPMVHGVNRSGGEQGPV